LFEEYNYMRVSMHLILLTFFAALGAALLMGGVTLAYLNLEDQRNEQRKAVETLDDLDKVKEDLNRFLTTGDLVFGLEFRVNTYLLIPTITQLNEIDLRIQKISQSNLLNPQGLDQLRQGLKELQRLFSSLLDNPTQSNAYNVYNVESRQIIKSFQKLFNRSKSRVHIGSSSIKDQKDELFDHALVLSLFYIVLIILLIVWGGQSISLPISELSRSAERSLEHSESFLLQTREGPKEVILLAEVLYRLINQLEGEVSKKTIDLEEENVVRRKTEEILRELTSRQAPLVEAWNQISEAIEILSPEGVVLYVNPAYLSLFKLGEAEEVLYKNSSLFEIKDALIDRKEIGKVIISHANHGLPWSEEIEVYIHNQKRIHKINSSPVFQNEDELVQIVVISRDITEERAAQASAVHNDRLAAIGTLAAGMAHEINNPLTYIKMSLDLIKDELEMPAHSSDETLKPTSIAKLEIIEAISDAMEGVDRVSHIVKSLLNIARSGGTKGTSEQIVPVNLLDTFQACAKLMKAKLSGKVEVDISIQPEIIVWGRRSELIQVFLNFFINAAQAMPEDRLTGNWIKVRANETDADIVKIMIQDNAKGIPQEDLEHIFEPFFTSKAVDEGTGLGLSVSKGIIEAHQGKVMVSSQVDVGTTFTLHFFRLEEALPKMIAQTKSDLVLSSTNLSDELDVVNSNNLSDQKLRNDDQPRRKILIVDDDILVGKSFAKMLREDEVKVVNSGFLALDILNHHEFDIILSDVMMPGLNGSELYWKIIEQEPKYTHKIIFITGATKGHKLNEAISQTGCPILNKPITKQQLLESLHQSTVDR
jgi:signal transduction histidine kinase/ActR/RegA family two-component response regulator